MNKKDASLAFEIKNKKVAISDFGEIKIKIKTCLPHLLFKKLARATHVYCF